MKIKLFGSQISPACKYCEHGRLSSGQPVVFCKKRGVVEQDGSCRSFLYAPLKRIPRRQVLPNFSKEDFEI